MEVAPSSDFISDLVSLKNDYLWASRKVPLGARGTQYFIVHLSSPIDYKYLFV